MRTIFALAALPLFCLLGFAIILVAQVQVASATKAVEQRGKLK